MLYREIAKVVGTYFVGFSFALLLPLFLSVYYQFYIDPALHPQPHPTLAFEGTWLITLALGSILRFWGRKTKGYFFRREGLMCVVLIWFLSPVIGAMPFLLSGTLTNPVQAYFEATSGLTTTGASLLVAKQYQPGTMKEVPYEKVVRGEIDTKYVFYGTIEPVRNEKGEIISEGIEALGKPLLFWRSFMQWLGGLGIVVLFVAVLPALGVGGRVLYHAEMPGPLEESLTPRIKETASLLWKIYLGLTFAEIILLLWTNPALSRFDAVCITLSTISTGGFTVVNGSIGAYQNAGTEWVVLFFMLFGSINFSLYFYCLKGKFFRLYEPELIVYSLGLLVMGAYLSYNLIGLQKVTTNGELGGVYTIGNAIRQGYFQMISAQTSTGFAIADYDKWPYVLQVLMLCSIYLGGMSGSTAGGMKMMRHILLFRIAQDKVELLFRPQTVRKLRIGDRTIDTSAVITVLCFFLTVIAMAVLGTFLLTLDGLDPETSIAVITSTINNSGMGFREAGPTDSFAFLSNFGCILTSIWMLMGRLEFFAVLVILVPAFWKED